MKGKTCATQLFKKQQVAVQIKFYHVYRQSW